MKLGRGIRTQPLRFWLPVFLLLLASSVGLVLYVVEFQSELNRFEAYFKRSQTIQASRILSDVERWLLRQDMDTVQSIIAELGLNPNLQASVYLDSSSVVLAATRRSCIGEPFKSEFLALPGINPDELLQSVETSRAKMTETSLFTPDREGLIICLPTSLPLRPGELGVRAGGVLLVAYNLSFEKGTIVRRMRSDFYFLLGGVLFMSVLLGGCIHFLIMRRLERLKVSMADFADGKPITPIPSRFHDEISDLVFRFYEMAETIRDTMQEITDLYNNAPCGYQSLDRDGLIIRINDTELAWLSYQREEIVGKVAFQDLLTPQGRELFQQEYPKFKERGWAHDLEFEMIRKDGSILPVVINATAIRAEDSSFIMSRSVLHDITERRKSEAEIRRLNQGLERRVRERTKELETVNKELKSFAYSVSHDLRAPLRHLDGYMELLQKRIGNTLDEQGTHYMTTILDASKRMGMLIDDLLALSRTGRQTLSMTRVDLQVMVREIVADFKRDTAGRTIHWRIHNLPVVLADRTLIRVVWGDLLSNAIKFTRPRAVGEIEIGSYQQDGDYVVFVRDNGVGFDMKYVNKLFGVFQRLHQADEFEGTGIGLANVQRIINRHGGKAWAEGRVGQGATFYFSLPQPKP